MGYTGGEPIPSMEMELIDDEPSRLEKVKNRLENEKEKVEGWAETQYNQYLE